MASRRAFGSIERRKRKDGTYKPGFYAKFVWQGRRYVRSAGPDRKHARQKLDAAQGLLKSGVPIAAVLSEVFGDFDGARLSFRDACPLYLEYAAKRKRPSTLQRDGERLSYLRTFPWAGEYLGRITPDQLARHVQQRMAKGAKAATVNRELAVVSALFKWAVLMGYVNENPAKRAERPSERHTGREVYLTAPECHALLNAAEGVYGDIFEFAIGTGCRRGEMLDLQWRSVTLGEMAETSSVQIEPETSKTGKGRSISLTPGVFALLKRRHASRPLPHLQGEDRVFVLATGAPLRPHLLRSGFERARRAAQKAASEAGEKARKKGQDDVASKHEAFAAKLGRLRLHDLRHTAASVMVGAGVPIFDVSKILGHATLQMTMRYAHFAPEAGRAAVKALGEALARGA